MILTVRTFPPGLDITISTTVACENQRANNATA